MIASNDEGFFISFAFLQSRILDCKINKELNFQPTINIMVRFDDNQAFELVGVCFDSLDGAVLLPSDNAAFLNKMRTHKIMKIKIDRYGSGSQIYIFNLQGLTFKEAK